jgi:hypothetical protein
MRKTAKKTQVETCAKIILAANTEDLKTTPPASSRKKLAEISANYRLLHVT